MLLDFTLPSVDFSISDFDGVHAETEVTFEGAVEHTLNADGTRLEQRGWSALVQSGPAGPAAQPDRSVLTHAPSPSLLWSPMEWTSQQSKHPQQYQSEPQIQYAVTRYLADTNYQSSQSARMQIGSHLRVVPNLGRTSDTASPRDLVAMNVKHAS